MDTVNLLCSLLLLGLVLWGLISAARGRAFPILNGTGEDRPLSRRWTLALWGLIGFFTLLRLYRFGSVPGGMNQDGAMAAVDALALSRYGTDRFGTWLPAHFTAWGYGQMSVLLSYCMAPFFRLFGMSPLTARLPMLLWSFAGMAALYGLLRGLLSRRAALIGLLFLCVCPWHFMQSRWALDCNLFPHLFLLGLTLLWQGTRQRAALYGSMVFFALCMYAYGVAFLPVPLFLLGAALLMLRDKWLRWWEILLCALLYFGLSFPIYGTMLINATGRETVELPFVTMPFFPQSVRANDLLFFSPEPWAQLKLNARALWNAGFLQTRDLPWNVIDGFGSLYRCTWPLLVLGLGLAVFRALRCPDARRRLAYRLLLLYWVCALVTGLCVRQVNVNRINILFYAHILFLVLGVHALLLARKRFAWPLLALCLLMSALFFHSYFGPWADRISGVFYEDFLQAVDYAGEEDFPRLVITPDVQYEGSRAVSEILTQFQLQVDARYYQGEGGDRLPYRERFSFRNLSPEDLAAPRTDTAWVLKSGALPAELPSGWQVKEFGDYCVLWYEGA